MWEGVARSTSAAGGPGPATGDDRGAVFRQAAGQTSLASFTTRSIYGNSYALTRYFALLISHDTGLA
jgi:hypothetical protein